MVSCQANFSITTLCRTPCGNLNYQAYTHTSVHLISILLFELIIEWSFTKVVICMNHHSKMSIPIVTPFGSVIFLKWFELQQICRKTQDFSFSMEKNPYKPGFILLVYICIIVGDPLSEREGLDPINQFIMPHFCVCPKPWLGFPMMYVIFFFVFNDLRWEVVVDIGGIIEDHC